METKQTTILKFEVSLQVYLIKSYESNNMMVLPSERSTQLTLMVTNCNNYNFLVISLSLHYRNLL